MPVDHIVRTAEPAVVIAVLDACSNRVAERQAFTSLPHFHALLLLPSETPTYSLTHKTISQVCIWE